MSDVNSLLKKRLKSKNEGTKTSALAEKSASGELSSFSGLFRISPLTSDETAHLENILKQYRKEEQSIVDDLQKLSLLTSELKAINNQALILHGERIKKAQTLLKKYKEGAFSSWLIAIYGNRQTPYNFLQYYEFYLSLPKELQEKTFELPRQAVYTLASRSGAIKDKIKVIREYKGEPKDEILAYIRKAFPLNKNDKRKQKHASVMISTLSGLIERLQDQTFSPSDKEKTEIIDLLNKLIILTNKSEVS